MNNNFRTSARGKASAVIILILGITFILLAGIILAGAIFGFGSGVFTRLYFVNLYLLLFFILGILGVITGYKIWPRHGE